MELQDRLCYEFGGFRLDSGRRLLYSVADDSVVALTPRLVDLLLFLVERNGQLVDKRTLLDALWPNVIVEENNLTQAVSSLRRKLGERPSEHRFIATVPGRGYRFVAAVREAKNGDEAGAGAHSGAVTERSDPRATSVRVAVRIAAYALSLIAVVGAAMLGVSILSVDGPPRVASSSLITDAPGDYRQPTLSLDGNYVAFTHTDAAGRLQIWVQNLAVPAGPLQVTFDEVGARSPSWSPRGDWILYESLAGGIWRVGTLGTPEPALLIAEGGQPSYSHDGSLIVYEFGKEIRLANADGSGEHSVPGVPDRDAAWSSTFPALSPDGRTIVFFLQSTGPLGDYWVIPTGGGQARQITRDLHWGEAPAWMPDGERVVFASRRGGTWTLWSVRLDGGEPEALTSGAGRDGYPVFSNDGDWMLYTNTRVESRFVLTDPTTGGHETLYRSTNLSWFPNLSPDGRQVAFFAEVAPREQIFVLPVDGSAAPKQVTFGSARQANIAPRWYSDGFIDFYENLEARSLLRIPVEGGQPRIIFSEFQWEQNRGLVWSPDRALAAFVRTEAIANGQAPVVIREAATGAEWAVHPEMQSAPVWSQDQRHLLGIGKSGIVNCPVDGTACETLVPASDVGYANWSSDESQVFFLKRSQPRSPVMWDLRVVNRDGTGDRLVAALGPIHPLAGPFQVLPDDRILWNQYSESDTLIFRGEIAR